MKFAGVIVPAVLLLLAATALSFGADAAKPAEATPAPELTGVMTIAGKLIVCLVVDGEHHVVTRMGGEVGRYRLTAVDPEARFVDLQEGEETVRVWLREAAIKEGSGADDPLAKYSPLIESIKSRIVVVGGEPFSETRLQKMAESKVRMLFDESLLTRQLRERYLEALLTQKRILVIGPKGISEADAKALGMTPEEARRHNAMNNLGPEMMKLYKEAGEPVVIEAP